MIHCFENLIGSGLSSLSLQQARLSTKFGGIGLRASKTHSAAAYIASFFMSKPLIESFLSKQVSNSHINSAISMFNSLVGLDHCLDGLDSSSCPSNQHDLSHHIDSESFRTLLADSTNLNKARLLACSMPHATTWVRALPSLQLHGLELSLHNTTNFHVFMVSKHEEMAWNYHL